MASASSSRGAFAVVSALVALGACTALTSVGDLREVDGADATIDGADLVSDGSAPPDPVADANVVADATTVDGCGEASCIDLPPGFSLVAFGRTAKGVACPAGFGQPMDTVEGPSLNANACTCGCAVTSQPTCQQGAIANFFGNGGEGTCPNAGSNFSNDGCSTDGYKGPFGAGNQHRHPPPGPTGGACTGAPNTDATKLAFSAEGRVCATTTIPMCGSKTCLPSVGDPFRTCVAAQGDVACPAPFTQKTIVGSSASFTCSSGCTCSGVDATCTGGRLDFYSTTNCTGTVGFSYAVNDTCVSTNAGGASFSSYRYVASPPSSVRCNAAGTTTPSTPQLEQPTTVCCN